MPITEDDLVVKCLRCGRLHARRLTCERALLEDRELEERAAAAALNAAFEGGR